MTRVAHENPTGDYPEDFEHEDGNYYNVCYECGLTFTGFKSRVYCRECAKDYKPKTPDHSTIAYNKLLNRVEDLASEYGWHDGMKVRPFEYIEQWAKVAKANSEKGWESLRKSVMEASPNGC